MKEVSAAWTAHRNSGDVDWLWNNSCVPQQQALRHLGVAYKRFFEGVRAFPQRKSKRDKQSAEYTKSAFKWDAATRTLNISFVGELKVKWSREFTSSPSTVTITKDRAGRYFVTLCLEEAKAELPKTGKQVGIDVGLLFLSVLSSGIKIKNPRHYRRMERRRIRLSRRLSRRVKGSGRREDQRVKLAKCHAEVADCRKDLLDKLTTQLVREYDFIAIEDLHVKGMLKSRRLAKHIACAGWGMFRRMLEYKCKWYGKTLVVIDRFEPTSKKCSGCGGVVDSLPLDIRNWKCKDCGTEHDRDINAAKNILAAGLAVYQAEQALELGRGGLHKTTASRSSSRRSVNPSMVVCA